MNKRQKEVLQASLQDEKAVMAGIESNYTSALARIRRNIRELQSNPLTQSKAYQLEFQQQLEAQISGILDTLQGNNFTTIAEYLQTCYSTGFIGANYDWQGQGVPLTIPIDQRQVIKAVQKTGDDFKLSNKLGVNTKLLKEQVKTELQRGLASDLSYSDIARNITDYGQADMNRSKLIARTEGHRVQNDARIDAMKEAKKRGADIVKQWDSTLDGNTRPHHRELDGQIRELDESFEVAGMKVDAPGGFGIAAEDCNCRCCVLQRARWALKQNVDPKTGEVTYSDNGSYTKWNNETGGFIDTTGYEDFKDKYLKRTQKPVTIKRNTSSNFASGIGQKHYEAVHDIIDSCSDDAAVQVWGKYEGKMKVGSTTTKGTAYCDRGGSIHVDIDSCARGSSWDRPYQTVFHESGHAIDCFARREVQNGSFFAAHFSSAYEGGKFPTTIKKEVNAWVDSVNKRLKSEFKLHGDDPDWLHRQGYITDYELDYFKRKGEWIFGKPKYSKSLAYNAIEREVRQIPITARADLSDILEGATNGRISAGFGHGKKYWSDRSFGGVPDGLATEAFAEMMDSTFASPESLATIQQYLPESYGVFQEMLQFLLKG